MRSAWSRNDRCIGTSQSERAHQRGEDGGELAVFEKEAVVAEVGVDLMVGRARNGGSENFLVTYGEKTVGVDGYDRRLRFYAGEGLFQNVAPAPKKSWYIPPWP